MAKGMIRGVLAGLGVTMAGLVVLSALAPPPQRLAAPVPAASAPAALPAPQVEAQVTIPAAQPVRAPQPAAPPPVLRLVAAPAALQADAAPRRPAPPPGQEAAGVLAQRPLAVPPPAPQRALAAAQAPAAPRALAAVPPVAALPMVLPAPVAALAEVRPVQPAPAGPPPVHAAPEPVARPLAMAVPAAPPAPRAGSPAPALLSRSEANPALVLPGAAADVPPVTEMPPVRRPGAAVLAQADSTPSVMKKPAPLAPAPGLATAGAPVTEGAAQPGVAAAADAAAPPRVAFARPFDNAAQKPMLAVVLVDTGEPDLDRTALAALPFPVTFVLDPARAESALAAGIYRAGGQEVAMLATAIPQGATASDVEVTFAAHAAAMPEAVAVMVPETGGFQDNRPVATLVVPVVAGQGRGLLSWDRGLNAADQVARREGAHAATIFRSLDGKAEDAARIRQYLDRAAFKAAQEGQVVVAGQTRPETVRALLEWAVEGRASSVALAPLTAVLRAQ
jgi:hypothetical protein